MDFKVNTLLDKTISISSPYRRDLMYGRSAVLRRLAGFPYPLPILALCEHGVDAVQVDLFEAKCNPPVNFVFSSVKKRELDGLGKKNVIQIPDPFTMVANSDYQKWVPQIKKRNRPKNGTKRLLFFYAHSTSSVIDDRPSADYISEIMNLSYEYDVTVCLHFSDLNRGIGTVLKNNGIRYVSISEHPRAHFCYKFFELVSNYDCAASTVPGSYLYYCVFMNIPFMLINLPPVLVNINDMAQHKDFSGFFNDYPNNLAYSLFTIRPKDPLRIERNQKEFVQELLGYTQATHKPMLVRQKIRAALYKALIPGGSNGENS